jgi:hypothetical protein
MPSFYMFACFSAHDGYISMFCAQIMFLFDLDPNHKPILNPLCRKHEGMKTRPLGQKYNKRSINP